MAKFTVVSNSNKKTDNVVPVKFVQTKTIQKRNKYLTILCVIEALIILGMLIRG